MKRTESAGGVVLNARGEIALVQNGKAAPAWWGFPKGHIDPGEDAIAAAMREIREETGLNNLTLVKPLGSYERYRGTANGGDDLSELKTIHMFLFTTPEDRLESQDPHNPEARWVTKDDIVGMLAHPKDRAFFERILPEL